MQYERLHIIVKGDVQRVGYRDRVQKVARNLGITGWVQNMEGYDVQIIAEGTDTELNLFKQEIQISDGPIHVESIEVEHDRYEGSFSFFEIKRGPPEEEMGERFDAALHYLTRIDAKSQRTVDIEEKMLEKQDQMLEKQDVMIQKQDQMLEKQESMIDLRHTTIQAIQAGTEEIRDHMGKRYISIEEQLDEIRIALKKAGIME